MTDRPDALAPPPLSSDLLSRASRVFNQGADLRTEQDRAINEWFKAAIAAARQREANAKALDPVTPEVQP
jgi:hypothetical protein